MVSREVHQIRPYLLGVGLRRDNWVENGVSGGSTSISEGEGTILISIRATSALDTRGKRGQESNAATVYINRSMDVFSIRVIDVVIFLWEACLALSIVVHCRDTMIVRVLLLPGRTGYFAAQRTLSSFSSKQVRDVESAQYQKLGRGGDFPLDVARKMTVSSSHALHRQCAVAGATPRILC